MLTILLFLFAQAHSETLIASSGKARVPLVELYSSESCSSCPPADAWVSSLKDRADLWKKFVPVVFHVDYWNGIGWKDGFSSSEMTKRQVALSQLWSEPAVYTPAVVVDGKEWKAWHGGGAIPSADSRSIELSVFKDGDKIRVKISGLGSGKKYLVHLAKLGMNLKTDVKAGENAGRLLKHNFLILEWSEKAVAADGDSSFTLSAGKQGADRLAVAAWLEEEGNPTPLQAVGGYLN